jgi:hypothetical protein
VAKTGVAGRYSVGFVEEPNMKFALEDTGGWKVRPDLVDDIGPTFRAL